MTWYCCNRCRIAYADNGETPFEERFEHSTGRWIWSFPDPLMHPGGFVVRVFGGVGCKLAMRPWVSNTPHEIFHIECDETHFIYLENLPIGYMTHKQPGQVYMFELGFGYPPNATDVVVVWARTYNSDGELLAEGRTSMALNTQYIKQWSLDELSFSDSATRVEVYGISGPYGENCCLIAPHVACDTFHYNGTTQHMNWLTRGFMWRGNPLLDRLPGRIRFKARVRTTNGSDLYWMAGLGDCCTVARREVIFQANTKTAYLYSLCGHGGPRLVASVFLGGTFFNSGQPQEYTLEICIHEERYFVDENFYYRSRVAVTVSDSVGVVHTGIMRSYSWMLLYPAPCVLEGNGLSNFLYSVYVADLFTNASNFIEAWIDNCQCRYYELPGVVHECLADLCLTGYWPPEAGERPPAPEWELVLNLPGVWSFANRPPFDKNAQCHSVITPESTLPEGDESDALLGVYQQAIANYIASNFDVPQPVWESFCAVRTWYESLTNDKTILSVCASVNVPLRYRDVYEAASRIPVFVLVKALRMRVTKTEDNTYAMCWAESATLLAGISPYPNCSQAIQFTQLIEQRERACYDAQVRIVNCPDCTDEVNLEGAAATLTPYHD